jgi:hypothetical protein
VSAGALDDWVGLLVLPITKIGSGLHPKVKQEKGLATDQLNKREFNKLGFGPKVLAKIKNRTTIWCFEVILISLYCSNFQNL